MIIRMPAADDRRGLGLPGDGGLRKADLSNVEHEHVRGEHIAPAMLDRALAKVRLLAVSLAEGCFVERSDLAQALTPDEHAGADPGREIDRAAGICHRTSAVDL